MEHLIGLLSDLDNFITSHTSVYAYVLGILFAVAKITPTANSGKLLTGVQNTLDFAAKGVTGLGSLVTAVTNLISEAIKSDGIGGAP